MNINDIIIKPEITEKSSMIAQLSGNKYVLVVNKKATKTDIRNAVETIFKKSNAKVSKVNIINVDKKPKNLGRYKGFKASYKKAIVTLKDGMIPIYKEQEVVEDVTKRKKQIKIIDTEKILNKDGGNKK